MKTLFSRILTAQVVTVVLALLVVTVITRASLNEGFRQFLGRQENAVLAAIAPVLTQAWSRHESWDFLRENPQSWHRIWRSARTGAADGNPRPLRGRPPPPRPNIPSDGEPQDVLMHWLRQPGRGMLRERLFLLDETGAHIAGAEGEDPGPGALYELLVGGEVIGWIGFTPAGDYIPPEAGRFLKGQVKITVAALALALLVATALAWLLARNVSRPIRELGGTLQRLGNGHFETRAPVALHDEIGSLAANVNHLAESLEKSRTARQRWMADIAHELRTPVSVLKGEIEALTDGVRQVDDGMVRSLAEEVELLAGLVDDLQALALADAGALDIRRESVDFSSLIGQSAALFEQRFSARDIAFRVAPGPGIRADADPQRLRQLLHNLLENSSRYVEDHGTVKLSLECNRAIELVLEDSGPGVSDAQLAQLFDRFYRVEGSRARATGGSGLGLAICRNIVEAHGGSISAEHSALGGLLIRARFPRGGVE